eukprot:4033015-Alexandrium_andersonii.AAC.1
MGGCSIDAIASVRLRVIVKPPNGLLQQAWIAASKLELGVRNSQEPLISSTAPHCTTFRPF